MGLYFEALIMGLSLSVMAVGTFLTLKIFNIPDITTDGSYTLGGVVTGLLLVKQTNIATAVCIGFFSGALAGIATGFIATKLKVNVLLSGILVMTALYSINLTLLGRSNIPLQSNTSQPLVSPVLIALVAVGIWAVTSLLLKTDLGIAMRATGSSEPMVRANGVNTNWMKIMGLGMANGLIAVSGSIISMYQGFVDINMGIGIVITGLGAAMIGESLCNVLSVQSIALRVGMVAVGALIFQLLLAVALDAGLNPNLLKLVTSCLVLCVVALPSLIKPSAIP